MRRIGTTLLALTMLFGYSNLLRAQDMSFTVRLTTPLSTDHNHKGDPVSATVVQPQQFSGDVVQGHVTEVKGGGKLNGQSVLSFNFDTLNHGGAAVPISSAVTSFTNSKGQTNVDEEGRIIRKSSNGTKAAAATGAGALIGGLTRGWKGAAVGAAAGGVGSLIIIEAAAEGPKVEFAPGAQLGLSVKSRGGPELASLAPNASGATAAQSSTNSGSQANAASTTTTASTGGNGAQPDFTTVKIDFVPGEKTIFFDDFSDMGMDEPPPHWKVRGNAVELRAMGPVRELHADAGTTLTSPVLKVPKNFTWELDWTGTGEIEWKLLDKDGHGTIWGNTRGEADQQTASTSIEWAGHGPLGEGRIKTESSTNNTPVHFALWVQEGRVRAYLDGKRVLDVNQVDVTGIERLVMEMARYRPNGLRRIRIAESAPDFSTAINAAGRYVTHGIHFDTDSARLTADSAPVIKAVANGLMKNPNLKLTINGHTDSTGDKAHNLDLSAKRAEAVKSVLVSQFGIDAARLTTAGLGANKPIGSNDTADGRAENRRVEFVKQ